MEEEKTGGLVLPYIEVESVHCVAVNTEFIATLLIHDRNPNRPLHRRKRRSVIGKV